MQSRLIGLIEVVFFKGMAPIQINKNKIPYSRGYPKVPMNSLGN